MRHTPDNKFNANIQRTMAKTFTFEKFSSISEYINIIGSRPINPIFVAADKESSKNGDAEFTGTASYLASVALANNGFKKGLDDLNSAFTKKLSVSVHAPKSMPCSGPIGHSPIVANAILGLPNSMVYTKKVIHKTKVVSIWYDPTADCGQSTSTYLKAGRNVLELIMYLEQHGYRVELNIVSVACGSEQIVGSVVKLKTDKQPMNPLKISYPLLHSSYERRQFFKFMETMPTLTDKSLPYGYGTPFKIEYSSPDERRKALREAGIMPENAFFTDFYEAKDTTPEKLMELMHLS